MEASPTSQRTLRPLGVGEILDRGVTLCVRNFPVLALIWGAFAVLISVLAFLGTQDQSKMYAALADALRAQSHGGTYDWNSFITSYGGTGVFNVWTVAYIAALLLVTPLPAAALIAAVSRMYLGVPATFAAAYGVAVSRYLHLVMYTFLWILSGGAAYLVFVLGGFVIAFALVALASVLHTAGIAIAVFIGIVFTLVVIAFALVAGLAYQVGVTTCVIERRNFAESFTLGIRRVFTRVGLGRSLLVGLAYLAISIGYILVSMTGQALVYGLAHSQALGLAYTAIVEIAGVVFMTAFMTIFYYDLRVREEGFDLELSAADAAVANAPA